MRATMNSSNSLTGKRTLIVSADRVMELQKGPTKSLLVLVEGCSLYDHRCRE